MSLRAPLLLAVLALAVVSSGSGSEAASSEVPPSGALNGVFAGTIASELDGQRTDDLAYYDFGGRYLAIQTFRTLVDSEFTVIGLETVSAFDRSFAPLGGIGGGIGS